MTARRLGPADAALWAHPWTAAQADAPTAFAPRRERSPTAAAARRASARAFVWEEAGSPLAWGLWCRDPDRAHPRRGWIEGVFVAPEARGCGLAARLIDAMAADAAAAGMEELWLEVGEANHAARAAYARAGFAPASGAAAPPGRGTGEVALRRSLAA